MANKWKPDMSAAEQIRKISEENEQDLYSFDKRVMARRHRLYKQSNNDTIKINPFILRAVICLLLFIGYYFMQKEDRVLGRYDSQDIKNLITEDYIMEEWKDIPVFRWIYDVDE